MCLFTWIYVIQVKLVGLVAFAEQNVNPWVARDRGGSYFQYKQLYLLNFEPFPCVIYLQIKFVKFINPCSLCVSICQLLHARHYVRLSSSFC